MKSAPRPKRPKAGKKTGLARKTISLPSALNARAEKNAVKRGFQSSFSAYVAWLIVRDTEGDVKRETLA